MKRTAYTYKHALPILNNFIAILFFVASLFAQAAFATSPPKRIVVLNAANTEIVFELGQGDRIVGTDAGANYPEAAKSIAKVGHPYRPSVEGIISLKPDLVIASEENLPPESAAQLRSAKMNLIVLPNSGKDGIEGLKNRINKIADLLSSQKDAKSLTARIDRDLAKLTAKVKAQKNHPKVFFLYAHGPSKTFIYGKETGSHSLIEAIGGINAADFMSGTKPLTSEAMVQAAPEAIIMLERGLAAVGGKEEALKLPGVSLTPAGKNKKVIAVDDSIRWIGPRFVIFAEKLFDEVYKN